MWAESEKVTIFRFCDRNERAGELFHLENTEERKKSGAGTRKQTAKCTTKESGNSVAMLEKHKTRIIMYA